MGEAVYVASETGPIIANVSSVEVESGVGFLSPITEAGTIVVDGVVASCYVLVIGAVSHEDAHVSSLSHMLQILLS